VESLIEDIDKLIVLACISIKHRANH